MTEILRLILGFTLWSVFFLLIYAVQATGCALGADPTWLRVILGGTFALAIVAAIVPVLLSARGRSPLVRSARWASLAALGATVLVFSGVLWMSPC